MLTPLPFFQQRTNVFCEIWKPSKSRRATPICLLCSTVHQNVYMDQAAAINAAAAFFTNTTPDGGKEPLPDGFGSLVNILPVAVSQGDHFCTSEILAASACHEADEAPLFRVVEARRLMHSRAARLLRVRAAVRSLEMILGGTLNCEDVRSKVRKTTITDMFLAAELAVRDIARAPERVGFGGLALLADSVFNDVRIVLGKDNWTATQQLRKIQCGLTCASLSEAASVRYNCRGI